jgi:YfiR/HmsC-like
VDPVAGIAVEGEGLMNCVFRPVLGQRRKLFLICVALGSFAITAQAQSAGEYQIKAAFLFNFAKFVEWPPGSFSDASAPLQICVLGQDPFGEELRKITDQKIVNGRKLQVRDVIELAEARNCHILFIAASEKLSSKKILAGLHGASVLTVSDTKGFVGEGGVINFVLENDRVMFEVSPVAAERAGLKISSRLLSVAKLVAT